MGNYQQPTFVPHLHTDLLQVSEKLVSVLFANDSNIFITSKI